MLVLPGHTTHVTQMFDVVITSPLKSAYTKLLVKLLKENDVSRGDQSKAAKARYLAVRAFLNAWDKTCTLESCRKAAKVCGYHPFNREKVCESPFVHEFSAEEESAYNERMAKRNRLSIGGKLITKGKTLAKIAELVAKCPPLAYLSEPIMLSSQYTHFVSHFVRRRLPNNCYYLGRLPPFVSTKDEIIQFIEPND